MSNSLDPDQAGHDLGPHCLKYSSADDTSRQSVNLCLQGVEALAKLHGYTGSSEPLLVVYAISNKIYTNLWLQISKMFATCMLQIHSYPLL